MTSHRCAFLSALVSLALVLGFVSACSPESADKNPVIVTKFKQIESDLKGAKDNLMTMETEIEVINKDLAGVKNQIATAGGGEAQTQKIAALEKQNQDLRAEMDSLKKTLAELKTASAARPVAAAPATASASQPKTGPAERTRPAPTTAGKTANRTQAGTYYSVKEGDTISSIAKAHGLKAEDVRAANHLPGTVDKMPAGAQVFVPAAR